MNKPTDLVRAIEENSVEFLLALGRAGGGDERADERIHWTIGGSPIGYHNCVVRADLDVANADAAIAESRELMRAKGVPGSWHVGPSMRPGDIGERLLAHGFERSSEPGMAADLDDIPEIEQPPGLTIERVGSEAELDNYAEVLSLGFGEGPKEARWVRSMYSKIGLGGAVPWRHYLGRIDQRPVATATLFLAAGAAGVYFVSTVPDFRGRGIGSAITRASMLAARELGYHKAVLGSSPMGHGVYRRLGFEVLCSIGVYEWSPG